MGSNTKESRKGEKKKQLKIRKKQRRPETGEVQLLMNILQSEEMNIGRKL